MQRPFVRRLIALAAAAVVLAEAGSGAATRRVEFTDTRLDNGLRVIVAEDHTAPTFAIAVHYNVGSRDERKGRTGFAHLFEHMMFKGSNGVGSGEHFYLVFTNGGDMNGTTNKDRTLYFERLPSNQLDLGLFLEADRMRSLAITKENLDNQRHAVQEERRLGVDNQPYGKTFEAIDELAYDNFANEHSVIGSMEDLSAASVDDVAEFFKTYYAPNNAVLAIVGDVKTDHAIARIKHHFGSIPSQAAAPKPDLKEPQQTAERRTTLQDPLAPLPRVDLAWRVPPSLTPDHDALTVLAGILGGGRSSRFYEAIVRQKQLSPNVAAFALDSLGPSLFRVFATAGPGKTAAELEAAIQAEIDRVTSGPIEAWEIDKARNNARRAVVQQLGSTLQRAILLSQFAGFYDQPDLTNTRAERLAKVAAGDVQRVAKQYLSAENRTVVVTMPGKAEPQSKGGL
jgi:zinc protease